MKNHHATLQPRVSWCPCVLVTFLVTWILGIWDFSWPHVNLATTGDLVSLQLRVTLCPGVLVSFTAQLSTSSPPPPPSHPSGSSTFSIIPTSLYKHRLVLRPFFSDRSLAAFRSIIFTERSKSLSFASLVLILLRLNLSYCASACPSASS